MVGRVTTRSTQRFGRREAAHVEPSLAVLADGLDDERVAFPAADRISHPLGCPALEGSGRPSVKIWR